MKRGAQVTCISTGMNEYLTVGKTYEVIQSMNSPRGVLLYQIKNDRNWEDYWYEAHLFKIEKKTAEEKNGLFQKIFENAERLALANVNKLVNSYGEKRFWDDFWDYIEKNHLERKGMESCLWLFRNVVLWYFRLEEEHES